MSAGEPILDPRWEWAEIRCFADPTPTYVRGRCNHLDVVPVESVVTGEVIAQLCRTCDTQLPGDAGP